MYRLHLSSNAVANRIYVDSWDPHTGVISAVHLALSAYPNEIHCGTLPLSMTCVTDANAGSAANTIFDPVHNQLSIRNLTAVVIGTSTVPVNNIIFGSYVVANLPSNGNIKVAWVNDSADGSCTSGGGSLKVWCFWDSNSMAWEPLGNLSSPRFTAPNVGAATGTSLLAKSTVDGTMPVAVTTGATNTLGGTYQSGYTFNQSTGLSVTYNLPSGTIVAGQSYCIANSNNGSGPATSQLKLVPSSTTRIIFTNGMLTTSMTGYLQSAEQPAMKSAFSLSLHRFGRSLARREEAGRASEDRSDRRGRDGRWKVLKQLAAQNA